MPLRVASRGRGKYRHTPKKREGGRYAFIIVYNYYYISIFYLCCLSAQLNGRVTVSKTVGMGSTPFALVFQKKNSLLVGRPSAGLLLKKPGSHFVRRPDVRIHIRCLVSYFIFLYYKIMTANFMVFFHSFILSFNVFF